ncbi:hypothetical protein ACFU8Q_35515 [Streptomyces sp. NPDC057543]|uniref:hypothetical protein n=1 Tax=Streptomyces sp. NPDC057543 TaxID=3346163 RepID=UPI0036B18BED
MPDARLDAALAAPDHGTALAELAADPPGGAVMLAARVGGRYEGGSVGEQQLLRDLLRLLREDGHPVALDLLARVGSTELLSPAVQRGLAESAPVLDGLVEQLGYTTLVVDALGLDSGAATAGRTGATV